MKITQNYSDNLYDDYLGYYLFPCNLLGINNRNLYRI